MPGFPHEAVPDGDVLAPHHLYLGALAVLLVVWVVSDDRTDREPWAVAVPTLAALVGFTVTWRHYPAVGASITLVGLCAALAALVARPYWSAYQWVGFRGAALVALLVALDDVVQHATGWPTPLDEFWARWLHPAIRAVEALA